MKINNNIQNKNKTLYIIKRKSKFNYKLSFNNTISIFIKVRY